MDERLSSVDRRGMRTSGPSGPARRSLAGVFDCNTFDRVSEPFDLELLDDEDPFEIDDPTKCRPIGCCIAAEHLVTRYREDR